MSSSTALRERRKAAGRCYVCGINSFIAGCVRCHACISKERASHAEKRARDVASRVVKVCGHCGVSIGVDYKPKGGKPKKFCSPKCGEIHRNPPKREHKQVVAACVCLQCGIEFFPKSSHKQATCSAKCRVARLSNQLKGKKYKPARVYDHVCSQCGHHFTGVKRNVRAVLCQRCSRRSMRRGRGKYRERCKRAGVLYVAGVTRDKVFTRDGYRCHLCGCKTSKSLRGKNHPRSPELDHILPISMGGGHTWDNVACACRQCNGNKSAKPLGQLRLAV